MLKAKHCLIILLSLILWSYKAGTALRNASMALWGVSTVVSISVQLKQQSFIPCGVSCVHCIVSISVQLKQQSFMPCGVWGVHCIYIHIVSISVQLKQQSFIPCGVSCVHCIVSISVQLTLIKGACQPLPNEGHVGDFSPTETALLEKILQCPA